MYMDINSSCLLLIIFTWTGNFVHAETTEDTQRVFVGNREISGKQMIWIYCEWSINTVDGQANWLASFTRLLRSIDNNIEWRYTWLQFSGAWHLHSGWCFQRMEFIQEHGKSWERGKSLSPLQWCRVYLVGMYMILYVIITALDEKIKIFIALSNKPTLSIHWLNKLEYIRL